VTTDRDNAIYRVGETARFTIRLEQNMQPLDGAIVQWWLTKDGGVLLKSGATKAVNGIVIVNAKLNAPGFMQLRTEYWSGAQATTATIGAGFDPLAISPSMPVPDDFDAFWYAKKVQLAEVTPTARVKPIVSNTANVTTFDVQVDALGSVVSGYLALPVNAKNGTLPAILTFHGAGVDSAVLDRVVTWAEQGLMPLDINAHGILNGQSTSYYKALGSSELAKYRIRGRESRDEFYFLGMYLRVLRAIDYLTTRPEWDGRTLVLYGTSQGAAQAFAGAALDSRVTFLAAGVVAMADLTGLAHNRPAGWPGKALIAGASPEMQHRIMNTVRYFDTANFATRVKADGVFAVGFTDPKCPPSTVYAAYNSLKTTKYMHNDIATGHVNTPNAVRVMREAVFAHVESMRRK
jgi:cephalosporin-C deacetylase